MTPLLVMLHGWGFDRQFWRPLRDRLGDMDCIAWDLGFYGEEFLPAPPRDAVAIGHSYGLLWLLQTMPFKWRGLVAINGFTRFVSGAGFPDAVDPKQVDRLSASLSEDPRATLAGFRQRCGDDAALPQTIDATRLQAGLDHLRQWDQRGAKIDLALCGESDKVVSAALSRACFNENSIRWHDGGHLLPLQDPDWCAGQVRSWYEEKA